MVYTYGPVILWDLNFGSFCEWQHLPDLQAYVSFWVTTVLLFHIYSQTRSSVLVANKLMNSSMKKMIPFVDSIIYS